MVRVCFQDVVGVRRAVTAVREAVGPKTKLKIYSMQVSSVFPGRIGYVLFYNFLCFWIANLLYLFRVWGRRHVLPRRAYRRDTGDDYLRRSARSASFFQVRSDFIAPLICPARALGVWAP